MLIEALVTEAGIWQSAFPRLHPVPAITVASIVYVYYPHPVPITVFAPCISVHCTLYKLFTCHLATDSGEANSTVAV